VLGDAIYRNEELAVCAGDEADFDRFWTHNPISILHRHHYKWLKEECLTIGDFYSIAGTTLAQTSIGIRLPKKSLLDCNPSNMPSYE
jgi:hypothetical protein